MRQSDGSELLGAQDPRGATIGLIEVAPDDDRQSILDAIVTQDELGREQTVIVLPNQNRAFNRPADFDRLKNMRSNLHTQIIFVAPKGSGIAELARQHRFAVFSSVGNYIRSFQKAASALGAAQAQRKQSLGREQKPVGPETDALPFPAVNGAESEQPSPLPGVPMPVLETAQMPPGKSPEAAGETGDQPDFPRMPPVPEVESLPAAESEESAISPPAPVAQPHAPPADVGRHKSTYPLFRTRQAWLRALLLLLLFLLLGGIVFGVLGGGRLLPSLFTRAASSATVFILPDHKNLKHTYAITVVTRPPKASQHEVEARLMSSTTPSQSMTVQVTGVGTIPALQAQGTLTLYNSLPYSQTVASGTVFTDAKGIQVVNDQSVVIPAARPPTEGSVTVAAHAVNAGADGNIPAFDFNTVPCCSPGVTVANTKVFHSGQDAQRYSFVQQRDIDSAANSLETSLTQSGQKALLAQILPNEQLIAPVRCVPSVVSDHAAGDKSASVTVTVVVICIGETYDRRAVQSLAVNLLKTDAMKVLGIGYTLEGNIVTAVTKTTVPDAKGTVSILVSAEGKWIYLLTNARERELAKLIAGRPENDANALLLQQRGVSGARIVVSGGNGNTLPTDPDRIRIILQSPTGYRPSGYSSMISSSVITLPFCSPG